MKDDCYNEWWIFYHLPSGTGSISSVGSTVATGSERQKRKAFLDTWPPAIVFFFLKHVFGQGFRDKFSWSFLWIRQTNEYQARTNILHEVWKERNLPREIKVPTYRISLSKRLRLISALPWTIAHPLGHNIKQVPPRVGSPSPLLPHFLK